MHPIRQNTRITELRAIIDSYRTLSVEEAEASDAGDREIEAVAELWRLEQSLGEPDPAHEQKRRPRTRRPHAA